MIEVNQRVDHQEVRSHFLHKTIDYATAVPGDGSITLDPARRKNQQAREHAKPPNFEVFESGNGVSIKETKDRPVRLGWIIRRAADAVSHDGTPFENTECRRYDVEIKKPTDGAGPQPHEPRVVVVDARSLKHWKTSEKPRFKLNEEEERELRTQEEGPREEERQRDPEHNQHREENHHVEPTQQLETPTAVEPQQQKRPVGRPKKQPQQPQPPQQPPKEEQPIFNQDYMGSNHIIGSSDHPKTTRSGNTFLAKDLLETEDCFEAIKEFNQNINFFRGMWGYLKKKEEEEGPEIRKRDNDRCLSPGDPRNRTSGSDSYPPMDTASKKTKSTESKLEATTERDLTLEPTASQDGQE